MSDSWLTRLLSNAKSAALKTADAYGEFRNDTQDAGYDMGMALQGFGDQVENDPISALYNSSPVGLVDNAVNHYTGSPLLLPSQDAPNETTTPVIAGVSPDEEQKAITKYADVHAKAMAKRQEMEDRQNAIIEERLQMLLGQSDAADSDVFVAKGDRKAGGKTGDKGSFSRSNKPIATYDESDSVSADEATAMGVPKDLATLAAKLSKAKTSEQAQALKLVASSLPNKSSPQEQDINILNSLMKSKDPIGALPIAKAIFRRLGRSNEYISALLDEAGFKNHS